MCADDEPAELTVINAAAASTDSLDEIHIYDTSCETVTSTGRRRRLSGVGDSLEITLHIRAPAFSSSALAAGVVADLNTAVEDGSFAGLLQDSNMTAFSGVSAEYVSSTDAAAVPTAMPTLVTMMPTATPTTYYSKITKEQVVAVVVILLIILGVCCCICCFIGLIIVRDRHNKRKYSSLGAVYATAPDEAQP